ncbi:hypothetical protein EHF33_14130 [Deinococcus psychrotolerans]|uniref:Uncharacterized protein n=1 Tax=Deinococcus psychrotolerans TaxID=2489213 RepID=A0A3G8YGG7_9DEIO|nr:hypothetical protein [Deinococcus psychrotolerans]AZI44053.1 hypothetical protein EHF33_14130 [Deinococcus psychrotolerans]
MSTEPTLDVRLAQAREQLKHCTSAYDIAQVTLDLLGIDRCEAYQALPSMKGRTLRRVISALPVVAVPDAVHMYLTVVQKQKGQLHVDSNHLTLPDVERIAAETFLPVELQPVVAAAVAARVSPTTALKAVVKYRNPVELVTQRLRDMKRLAQHRIITNPGGFFTHLMRQNKDVELPGIELAKEAVPRAPKEQKAPVKPLEVGDIVKLYNALCRVIRVGAARSDIEHPDGYEMGESNERLLVCRSLVT